MKKYLYICLVTTLLLSCSDKETILEVSSEQVTLTAAGTPQKIEIRTNEMIWQTSGNQGWITISRDSCYLVIQSESNPTRSARSAKLVIIAGDKHVRINVTQPGSVRAVGEPYPDEQNPIGVIYKLLDGGNHGYIVSLDEYRGKWGKSGQTNTPGARDLINGKASTRYMIETYRNDPDFDDVYQIFSWVYKHKNNSDIDGMWYIPSYTEMQILYGAVVGANGPYDQSTSMTTAITHNPKARENFGYLLKKYGGVDLNYDDPYYWLSNEYNSSTARFELLRSASQTSFNIAKTSVLNVRAIRQF